MNDFDNGCYGICPDCNQTRRLGVGNAMTYAHRLMSEMVVKNRLDIDLSKDAADPRLSLSNLFPGDRGHMFGVLETENQQGQTVWLKAFSSLRGGIRFVHGWVPPNLSEENYAQVVAPQERAIKEISAQWANATDAIQKASFATQRAAMSKTLWNEMKALYRFYNFQGRTATIDELFKGIGVPGGVGECCAPKLLCHAAQSGLRPKGLCEFYWGPQTEYDGKSAGQFYPCCEPRCRPLLGFLLCGADEDCPSPALNS